MDIIKAFEVSMRSSLPHGYKVTLEISRSDFRAHIAEWRSAKNLEFEVAGGIISGCMRGVVSNGGPKVWVDLFVDSRPPLEPYPHNR